MKPDPITPAAFETMIDAFGQALLAEGRSPKTISAYRRDLLRVAGAIRSLRPGCVPASVTPTLLEQALARPEVLTTERDQPRSPASLHRLKAAVKAFFSWAARSGMIAEDPGRAIRLHRLARKPPRFLSPAEKRRLLKELKGHAAPQDRRDRVMLEVLLGTGIRLGELVGLDVDDVDLDAKHLRVRAKGNVTQVKFLKTDLRYLPRTYLAERQRRGNGPCPALFLSNRQERISPRQVASRLEVWLGKAGIAKRLTPHGLRHTFATHLYGATSDLLVVQRALGHADVSTTQIYTHLIDGQLEEALERL